MADEPDDLDDLLAPPPAADAPELRGVLLRRTLRRVAVRRWARRVGRLAAGAAVFGVGVGVGVWRSSREHEAVAVPTPVPQIEVVAVPVFVPFPLPGASGEPFPVLGGTRTARVLELDAEQADGPGAAVLYRRAGDAYLTAEQDYANAARCYRLFLTRAGESALAPEPTDSWLLTSLKNAAFKEKVHATTSDG